MLFLIVFYYLKITSNNKQYQLTIVKRINNIYSNQAKKKRHQTSNKLRNDGQLITYRTFFGQLFTINCFWLFKNYYLRIQVINSPVTKSFTTASQRITEHCCTFYQESPTIDKTYFLFLFSIVLQRCGIILMAELSDTHVSLHR